MPEADIVPKPETAKSDPKVKPEPKESPDASIKDEPKPPPPSGPKDPKQ